MSRVTQAVRVLTLGVFLGSCHDGATTAPPSSNALLRGLVLSDPSSTGGASLGAESSAASSPALTFVSLQDGTANEAASARIANRRTTEKLFTQVTNGGFGPIGIAASEGDTLEVLLLNATNHELARMLAPVPIARRPVIVRTRPPRGKTDVPLNLRIEVVFSEPMDPASFRPGSLRLMQGSTPVSGRVEPGDMSSLSVAFVPSTPLSELATYTLEITRDLEDLDGETLEEAVTVSFTTTSDAPTGPSLTLRPDTLRVATDEDWPLGGWLVAAVTNADGEEVFGVPVAWSSSDPDILQLSSGPPSSLTGRSIVGLSGTGAAGVVDVVASSAFGKDTMTVIIEPARFVGVDVVANGSSKCFIADDGRIYCHGDNQFGQLGLGIADQAPKPAVAVASRERFAVASGGIWHSCALTIGGAAYCWGHNAEGQVGRRESRAEPTPVLVSSELTFSQVSVGPYHSCGLEASGGIYCWGVQWSSSSLELNRPGPVTSIPIRVPTEVVFRQVSAGYGHTCGIDMEGVAWCWGLNDRGQLGNGTHDPSGIPVRVAGELRFTWIDAGPAITCGVTTDGEAWCWGTEDSGGGYTSTLPETSVPAQVPLPAGVSLARVTVGNGPTCGLASDGSAWCWGFTWDIDLTDTAVPPTKVPGDHQFTSLSAGYDVCGVSADSLVYCWPPVAEIPGRVAGQR